MILVKQSHAIQLAHLYEHLFCMAVDNFFYDKKLFLYADYDVFGRVLQGGILYIDIELYTQEAKEFSKKLATLTIDLDQDTVIVAASQIIAEKEKRFGSRGYEQIKKELQLLDSLPWQNIDDIELIDSKGVRRKIGAFYLSKGKALPAQKASVGISLNGEFAMRHRELLPLFGNWPI